MRYSFVRSVIGALLITALFGPAASAQTIQKLKFGGTGSDLSACTTGYLYAAAVGDVSQCVAPVVDTTCLDAGVVCSFAGSATEGGAATSALTATNADNLTLDPSDCTGSDKATGIDRQGDLTCAADDDTPESGDFTNLTGGAGITNTAGTLATASGETDFLTTGTLTCGASTKGRASVGTTTAPFQYCDNSATPILRYAAFASDTGVADNATLANSVFTSVQGANASFYVPFLSATSGNLGVQADSGITYNPSTNVLTATTFSGNASTATALASEPGACTGTDKYSDLSATGTSTCTADDDTPDSDSEVPNGITVDLASGGVVTGGTTTKCARFDGSGNLVAATGDCTAGDTTGGVSDGDKGDVTVSGSGATWVVDSGAVDFSELSGSATDSQVPDTITVNNATNSDAVDIAATNTDTTSHVLIVDSAGDGTPQTPRTDTGLLYDASANSLRMDGLGVGTDALDTNPLRASFTTTGISLRGLSTGATMNNSSGLGVLYGASIISYPGPTSPGSIVSSIGLDLATFFSGTGDITEARGLDVVFSDGNSGTIGDITALYLRNVTGATNNWAIRSFGGQSAHAGNFRIGSTTAPTVALDVTGAMKVSSTSTFDAATASRCARFDASKNLVAATGDCASGGWLLGADGDKGDITLGGTGTTLTIENDAVTFAKMQNSAAAGLSVIGRNSSGAADFSEMTAASDNQVLRRSGTAVGFGTIVPAAVDGTDASKCARFDANGVLVAATGDCASGAAAAQQLVRNGTLRTYTNNTLTTIMSVTLAASTTYLLEFDLPTEQAAGTANFAVAIDWPSAPATSPRFTVTSSCDGGSTDAAMIQIDNTAYTLNQTAQKCLVHGSGFIIVDAGEGGTLNLRTAQGTTNANNTYVYEDAWLRATVY
jgi:hypothetical protein